MEEPGMTAPALEKAGFSSFLLGMTRGLRRWRGCRREVRLLPRLLQALHLLLYGHRIFLKHLLLLRRER